MCGWISSLPGLFLRDVPWVRMYASGLRILWPYLCAVCKPSHVCMELFIHSLANYVISSAVNATADCRSAGSRLSQCGTCTSELFYRPLMSYVSFCRMIHKVCFFFLLGSYFNWSVLLHRYFLLQGRGGSFHQVRCPFLIFLEASSIVGSVSTLLFTLRRQNGVICKMWNHLLLV